MKCLLQTPCPHQLPKCECGDTNNDCEYRGECKDCEWFNKCSSGGQTGDKELERLSKMATKLINKRELEGIFVSDITLSAISRIANSKTINDVPTIAIQALEFACRDNKIS
jgi:hypothetical protein